MDSDDEHRMRFSTDRNYEGGKWMMGEFYHKGERSNKKKKSKEEEIYGVFGGDYSSEGDDDDDDDGTIEEFQKGNKKRKRAAKDFSKPIGFISSGIFDKNSKGIQKSDGLKLLSDEDENENEKDKSQENDDDSDEDNFEEEEEKELIVKNQLTQILSEIRGNDVKSDEISKPNGEASIVIDQPKTNNDFRLMLQASMNITSTGKEVVQVSEENSKTTTTTTTTTFVKETENLKTVSQQKTNTNKMSGQKFAEWEKYTKGFGSKILSKFNFSGRLGASEHGISKNIEVSLRPQGMGLGFGNFQEASAARINKEIEAEWRNTTIDEKEKEQKEILKKLKSAAEKKTEQNLWKKSKKNKAKKKYITSEDLLKQFNEEQQQEKDYVYGESHLQQKQVIVDITGPEVRVFSSMEELHLHNKMTVIEKPKFGEELLHNITLLLNTTEVKLQTAHRQLQSEKVRYDLLQKEYSELEDKINETEDRKQHLLDISEILRRVEDKIENDIEAVSLDAVFRVFQTLRDKYAEEFVFFGLSQLAPAFVSPVLRNKLKSWVPLKDPLLVIELLANWKQLLVNPDVHDENDDNAMVLRRSGSLIPENPLLIHQGIGVFENIVEKEVLPLIRSCIINDWEVRDVKPCKVLIDGLMKLISSGMVSNILNVCILPKLQRSINEWNPKMDTVPIHEWVHPWLSYFPNELQPNFSEIRRKLMNVLTEWHPSDSSALIIIKPWKGVFDDKSMEQFLVKCIVPKLVETLRNYLVIDPRNQNIEPLSWVLAWHDVLPPLHFISLLEGEFFPKWLQVLHHWLLSGPDFGEVVQWYTGWKQCFPESIQVDPRIIAQFNYSLDLMNSVLTNQVQSGQHIRPGSFENMSYLRVVEQRKLEQSKVQQKQQMLDQANLAKAQNKTKVSVSFKEAVGIFAENHGITFIPRTKMYEGKQVFIFGGINIYIEQNVVFAELIKGNGKFEPISLDDLLSKVQK